MKLSIISHGVTFDFAAQPSDQCVFESIDGEPIAFRSGDEPILFATVGEKTLEPEAFTYSFAPSTAGLHRVQVTFASGKTRTLSIVRVGKDWLSRIALSAGPQATREGFRLVIRSMLRHGLGHSGTWPEGVNPEIYGSASGPHVTTYGELA